jgi:6-phosphogluconolactonase (cycloisomerase 2 family)
VTTSTREMIAYVGCYTTPDRSGRGEGITAYRMDTESGEWQALGVVAKIPNPSFLALHPLQPFLYCVHGGELSDVSGFAIDGPDQLRPLGTWPSGGLNPVHLDFSPGARWMVVANYTGATIAVMAVRADGQLGSLHEIEKLAGPPGPDPVQQGSAHPHDIPFDPTGTFVVVPDKGLDRDFVFRLDGDTGQFEPANPPYVIAEPGAGPRHVAFHPSQRWAYVINELNSSITTLAYEVGGNGMAPLQTISSVPAELGIRNTGSTILVHPSGRFVYASNRGHDSVGAFEIDQMDGMLKPTAWFQTGGKTPRAMALDPGGRFLYAANQSSDTIVTFRVDAHTGALTPTGQAIATGSPSSVAFYART